NHGVNRNDIIPIICDRTYFYIIAILAISKAGGAYLPIDKKLPIDRINYILNESNPKLILHCNSKEIINKLNENNNYNIYDLQNHNYSTNENALTNVNDIDDTCYVLFTSGTTGKPKGVLISHFNVYCYLKLYDDRNTYSVSNILNNHKINNILGITNFSFDAAQTEITISLMNGLTLVLANENICNDLSKLAKYIIDNNVEYINTTPTRFSLFMENDLFKKSMKNLKMVNLGGEKLSSELCIKIHNYSKCDIYNSYGPTECTVDCSYKKIDINDIEKISIGTPICNCKVYILDEHLKAVPIGVEGEIFIGGYGVGKGYLNREELTKEKFLPCPFNDDENDRHNKIMYKTGDLGKWNNNGEIEYIGRSDFQVKIHGQRIELEEIENAINEISGIDRSIVIDKIKETGDKYLMCYYITDNETIDGKLIRNHLKEKLPLYMVPNYFKRIKEVPLTSNGKLDRKALPEPTKDDLIKEKYEAPQNEIETIICNIYSEIFSYDVEEVGRMNDFYEMGGDSLLAIRTSSMIEKQLKLKINIKSILSNSIICDLAKEIEKLQSDNSNANQIEIIEKQNKTEFPVTSQQLGVYIDSIKYPDSIIYNIPSIYKFQKNVDISKVKECFLKIFKHQEILRSKYHEVEINGKTEIHGFIDNECSLIFEEYSNENMTTFIRPFKLSEAPLIRVGFVDNETLLIDMHHIISDGKN
ncbi:hypothetical protein PIROE2DRAFT_19276, partial [Piromyces sp. E2]